MKKVIKFIVVLLPAITLMLLAFMLQGGKNILEGIYIIFPLIYVLQGILIKSKLKLTLGILLSDIAFLISVNLWYNMGDCIDLAIIYTAMGIAAYIIKRIIKRYSKNKKNREH